MKVKNPAQKAIDAATLTIDRLYEWKARWASEKEYENFAEYRTAIVGLFERCGFADIKSDKRFRITAKFVESGHTIDLRINAANWKMSITQPTN